MQSLLEDYNANWAEQDLVSLHFEEKFYPNGFTEDPGAIVHRIHNFYFGNDNVTAQNGQNLTDMDSDRDFTHPTYMTAHFTLQAYSKLTKSRRKHVSRPSVYLYYLTEQVPKSFWIEMYLRNGMNVSVEDVHGAGHVDELQFLFPNAGYNYPEIPVGAPQYNFSKMLIRLWTSFADTGYVCFA